MALDWLPNVLWESAIGFSVLSSLLVGFVGSLTGSLTIGFVGAYTMFAFLAINADITLMSDVFLATIVLIVLGFGFKIWRTEGTGGT